MPQPKINEIQPRKPLKVDKVRELSTSPPTAQKPAKTIHYLSESEWERFYRSIPLSKPRDRAMFSLIYHAGLRATEVGLIQMRDYQPKATVNGMDRIFIHALKGSLSGDHHMARDESRALRAWLKVRGSHPGVIFSSNRGKAISRKQVFKLMRQYGALAELPAELRHPHALKHSCATHLLNRGMHVEQVQDWIRHKDIRSTMVYAQVSNPRREEMARLLQNW